jgi:hypothetical protein
MAPIAPNLGWTESGLSTFSNAANATILFDQDFFQKINNCASSDGIQRIIDAAAKASSGRASTTIKTGSITNLDTTIIPLELLQRPMP